MGLDLDGLRKKFVELSGREDLSGSGADFFINAGVRLLDLISMNHKSLARYQKDISAGGFFLSFKGARAVHAVWVSDGDNHHKLKALTMEELKDKFKPLDKQDVGLPKYYANVIVGLSAEQSALTSNDYTNEFSYEANDILFGDHYNISGILIAPPADKKYTVIVYGAFRSLELTNATDKNFWSEVYPELLLQAALYQLEVFYRNREGARDWLEALRLSIAALDKDLVEQESAEITKMEG